MLLTCSGCAGPFDTPTAYEGEPYLCEPAQQGEWRAEVDACRSERSRDPRSCGGVLSFRGVLQGQAVTVSSRLTGALFANVRTATNTVRARYEASGDSPYFGFTLQIKQVGGEVDLGSVDRELTVGQGSAATLLTDDLVDLSLRLSAGGDSQDSRAPRGTLRLSWQSVDEAQGTFEFALRREGDQLEGCFHFMATRTTTAEGRVP